MIKTITLWAVAVVAALAILAIGHALSIKVEKARGEQYLSVYRYVNPARKVGVALTVSKSNNALRRNRRLKTMMVASD